MLEVHIIGQLLVLSQTRKSMFRTMIREGSHSRSPMVEKEVMSIQISLRAFY
jgi:hypothetical protein